MQEKRREKAQCWRSKSQALRQTVMSRGLINGTAISNGMLSWKVSHREPPASLLTDSQERKEEGREDGRKRREGRKRGKALCPGPCQLPFANDLGKGIMIFHSAEICQVSSNITGTGRWQWSEANAVHYFSPPSPPTHFAETEHSLFYHHCCPTPLSMYCWDKKTSLIVLHQWGASQLGKNPYLEDSRRWKRYHGRHSEMSMNAAIGSIFPRALCRREPLLKLGPCWLQSHLSCR